MKIWSLIVAWVLYVMLVGPFLWSARDWILLAVGILMLIGLNVWTYKIVFQSK